MGFGDLVGGDECCVTMHNMLVEDESDDAARGRGG